MSLLNLSFELRPDPLVEILEETLTYQDTH